MYGDETNICTYGWLWVAWLTSLGADGGQLEGKDRLFQ